ncbi:PREDICTED: uncharacterized protein LOC108767108 [Trachymyrmex cornetzi]|uniref:uncharacterized protein LOC108767108 n=1 Tax=Trachymyrmex cornetzi TaxID=471704 RepID=UPI00084F5CAF|nr:PREDICTED: uncharacterized protein LOC108767108 [Trachymyrmex cornetzi]
MVFSGERYYNIYRILLTAVGLWPYQTPIIMQVQSVFFLGSYCFILLFQKQIKLDWNSIKDNNEIRILEKYANENRLLSLISSFILDAVIPMNKSRPRKVKIDFEFFIDEEQYFYIYLTYEIITVIIEIFTVLATATLSFALIRHCCATFKIASSNLIEETVTHHTIQIPAYQKTHVMCQRINRAVHIHRKSIRYNTMWYLAPIPIQKLLLFVMQNSLKTHTLILGHIYVTSLEGFSTVINTLY